MALDDQLDSSQNSPIFCLDEIQSNLYKLLSLFYSGIGIIQRDSPIDGEIEDADAILRLENNIKEIIGQFITTKDKLAAQIEALEGAASEFGSLDSLIEETRALDKALADKVNILELELPLYKEHLDQLIKEACEI
ncbi:hypothetical protein NEMIN01_1944 [Nematocida minor]|uniref:uncharacterized protein n=1 Tax=Nematocida minor TaxID=1912983 RepID=UPI002220E299|nr:uncharacterized protein NEMIN01_1944 [Nematocida minor]KAI5192315.1 hypothetical protein NEMIN01_1944 [Nematocida minor]